VCKDIHEVYRRAWDKLDERLDSKNSWGKNEVKLEMSHALKWAVDRLGENGENS
jgi:hypothetical protein